MGLNHSAPSNAPRPKDLRTIPTQAQSLVALAAEQAPHRTSTMAMINMRLTSSKQPERNSAARAPAPLRRQHRLPRFHRQAVLATKRRRPPHRFHSLRIRLLPRLVPGINLNPVCLIAPPLVSRQSFLVPLRQAFCATLCFSLLASYQVFWYAALFSLLASP